jgi:hypothetical protein
VLLIALPFVLFWRVWWPDARERRVFVHGDYVEQHYPVRSFVARELRAGRLPLWDPYTYGGESVAAESLFELCYPPGLWQTLFPHLPFLALEIEAIGHLSLAGVFTFLFVRRLTGSDGAGVIAGMAFELGGFLTSYPMLQLVILEVAAWTPLSLWLVERALARRSLPGVAGAGLVLGMSALAGHGQTLMYAAYLLTSYLLFRIWRLRLGWPFGTMALAVLGGAAAGIGAVQWLPSLEIIPLSTRSAFTYEVLSAGFKPAELLGLLRPNPGQWSPLYIGLVPLALAAVALALGRGRERWYWAGVAAIALLLSLGRNGPLYPIAYRLLPGFALFRQQERAAFLVSLSLSVLAGYGYAAVSRLRRWPGAALPVLLVVVFVDLYRANAGVILQVPPEGGYAPAGPVVQYLRQAADPVSRTSSEGLLPGDGNAGLLFGFRDVTGNGPLRLAAYEAFLERVPELRWWQLLDVRHVVTKRLLNHGALHLVLEEGDRRLYRIDLGQRHAWICHDYRLATDQDAAIEMTADPQLEPLASVVLERPPDPLPEAATGPEEATVVSFDRQRVVVEANLSAPGIVVLSEVDYPGWRVWANGRPVPTLRAYGLLRAVALPAGRWHLEWRFQPLSAYLGLALSALTLAGLVAVWLARRFAARRAVAKAGISGL